MWQTTGGTSTREWLRPRIQRPFEGVEAQMQGKELTIPLCVPLSSGKTQTFAWLMTGPRS